MEKVNKSKKEIVFDTLELLMDMGATVVKPVEVVVSIYRGCRKIGHSQLIWENEGVIYCIVKIIDHGIRIRTMTDKNLNAGNILRIYDKLKETYGEDVSGI